MIMMPGDRVVIPSAVSVSSRLPPKKRFLEAAAQQQQQEKLENRAKSVEDNSALMHLAEMCVYYQTNGTEHLTRSRSPKAESKKEPEGPIDPPVYSIRMSSTIQTSFSPKAASRSFWEWASVNRSLGPIEEEESKSQPYDEQNEEPLDLSGEETIRTNQQDLIDHLVEKLCAQPISTVTNKFSSLFNPKLSLLKSENQKNGDEAVLLVQNSSSEVSSSIDSKDSVTVNTKDIRRDLPLKKRDAVTFQQDYGPKPDLKEKPEEQQDVCCDSSWMAEQETSSDAEPVTSTNSSKKPAPRTCKGKRYLEFMYEGRITLNSRPKRLMESAAEQTTTPETLTTTPDSHDQTSVSGGNRKRQRHVKHLESMPGKPAFLLRGRNAKLRKLS